MAAAGQGRSAEERYWSHVVKDTPTNCWGWDGYCDKDGYAKIHTGSAHEGTLKYVGAHRLSWEIHNGPVPNGLWVLHHCDNPPCTFPEHLYLGTNVENARDRRLRRRTKSLHRTHCKRGHEFTEENTYYERRSDGGVSRRCRRCHADRTMESYSRGGRDVRMERKRRAEAAS